MLANFLVEGSQMELATLSGRGFNRSQITGLFARSTSLLALFAGIAGPVIARYLLVLWSQIQDLPPPNLIPAESWWLSLLTGCFSWIFLITSVYRSTRRDFLVGQGGGIRSDTIALSQRHPIWDVFVLTLGGLAFWQLTQGSMVTGETIDIDAETLTRISDLVLLLGPSLLLLAVGLILIRLLPYLWRLFARVSGEGRGLIWNLVFTRFAREPVGPGQVILLISLTTGLVLFASIFTFSIANWQQSMARYAVGADVRLQQPSIAPGWKINLPGSLVDIQWTQVIRTDATFLVSEYQRLEFDLLAVDPDSFPLVVSFPAGVSSFSMEAVMSVLQSDSSDLLPVIVSSNANTNHLNPGDQVTLELGTEVVPVEIVGIIINFPLLDDVFAITNLSQFSQKVDLETIALTDQGSREVWLAVEPDQQETVFAQLSEAGLEEFITGNSREQLQIFKNNLVFREVATAFVLSALILIPLSVVGFFLIHLFSARRRQAEFYVLQAMGLSNSQLKSLWVREGGILIALGTLLGIGIGFGLVMMMQPFLLQILPPLDGEFVFNQFLINWFDLGVRLFILVGFYLIGLLLLTISARRFQRFL
jgi:ABC-type lipoprotein release transport system permease subunit